MPRVGFISRVAPEHLEEYTARHREVWPDMQDALRRTGWSKYSLFLAPDGTLFGYVEVPDSLEEATARMQLEEVNARWQASVAHLFDTGEKTGDESLVSLEEVFHLD
ncbi:MAG TPA: L-rhamnose mutarotase [Propionibacteriaceae bacterium]|nr:L-rhamnose mutarotase [Propionibacteriaceae bacterium]